jgi:hypothetical protein
MATLFQSIRRNGHHASVVAGLCQAWVEGRLVRGYRLAAGVDQTGQSRSGRWGSGGCHAQQLGADAGERLTAPAVDRGVTASETSPIELAGTGDHGAAGQQAAELERCPVHCAARYAVEVASRPVPVSVATQVSTKTAGGRRPLSGRMVWCSLCGAWRARTRCGEPNASGAKCSSSTSGWPRAASRSTRRISRG